MSKPTLDQLRDAYGEDFEELLHLERIHGAVARSKLAELFDDLIAQPAV